MTDRAFKHGKPVTTSNTDTIQCMALYVGEQGSLHVELLSGDDVTFEVVPAGTTIGIRATKVFTDSSANSIIALY